MTKKSGYATPAALRQALENRRQRPTAGLGSRSAGAEFSGQGPVGHGAPGAETAARPGDAA